MGRSTSPAGSRAAAGSSIVSAGYPDIVRAFTDIADAMAGHVPLDALLHLTAAKVCKLFGGRRCSLYLREPGSDLFRGQVAEVGADVDQEIKRLVCGIESDGFTREILETRKPVLIRDALHDPRPVRAAIRAWEIRMMLGVPMIVQDEVIGIFFLDDFKDASGVNEEDQALAAAFANLAGVAISQARATEDLRSNAATIARQNKVLRRTNVLEERVTELALEGSSIQDIARAVATVTGQPAVIHGVDLRRLATATPDDKDSMAVSLFDPHVSAVVIDAALSGLAGALGPVVLGPFPAESLQRRFLVAPITARGECWGYLVIGEADRRLTALDIGVARRAAGIAALELSTSRRSGQAADEARESLVRDLVGGRADHRGIEERAKQFALDVDDPYAVALLRSRELGAHPLTLEALAATFVRCGYSAPLLAAEHGGGAAVVLVPLDLDVPRFESAGRLKGLFESVCETLGKDMGGEVVASVSSACRLGVECPQGLDEAGKVLQVLLTVGAGGGGSVLTSDDLGVGRLILGSINQAEARRFAEHMLGPLLEADEVRGNDLLQTLCVFFDSCRSVRRSSVSLDVHENTIRYRLARIAEITGLDLAANPDHQLSGQLAVLILRLQGRILGGRIADGRAGEMILA